MTLEQHFRNFTPESDSPHRFLISELSKELDIPYSEEWFANLESYEIPSLSRRTKDSFMGVSAVYFNKVHVGFERSLVGGSRFIWNSPADFYKVKAAAIKIISKEPKKEKKLTDWSQDMSGDETSKQNAK